MASCRSAAPITHTDTNPFLKKKILNISRRYRAELRKRLRGTSHAWLSRASSKRAENLGRFAVGEGLETLDLANIHGYALLELMPANGATQSSRDKAVKRAGEFFLEVVSPI